MKNSIPVWATITVLCFVGCGGQEPAQVCPAHEETSIITTRGSCCFSGVDLLVVVDSSQSMIEEQSTFAWGVFALINSLINPMYESGWPWREIDSIRVAVVTSDMGLQYGDVSSTEGFPYGTVVPGCTDRNEKGNDGRFSTEMPAAVELETGKIECEEGGGQCPVDWACEEGRCVSPSGKPEQVACPELTDEAIWAETRSWKKNDDLGTQLACHTQVGTNGCQVGQPLEAAIRGLSRNNDQQGFMKDTNFLAVLVVSDKEDCSIEHPGLFDTPEWSSGIEVDPNDPTTGFLRTACNLPASNEESFLFSTDRYWRKLVELKNDQPFAVFFGAIVGVPAGDNSHCQGRGDQIGDCLEHADMQLTIGLKEDVSVVTRGFEPACERRDGETLVTSASPGRRYVKVAESFGTRGYVSSVCNADWNAAMKDFAGMLREDLTQSGILERLDWRPLASEQQDEQRCEDCGVSKCDVVVHLAYNSDEGQTCPAEFDVPHDKFAMEEIKNSDGSVAGVNLICPLPKLPAELDCARATARYPRGAPELGWFYCEEHGENFEEACSDGIDNDGAGGVDCDDVKCKDCKACGGFGVDCGYASKFNVEFTRAAREAVRGSMVRVQCTKPVEDNDCP